MGEKKCGGDEEKIDTSKFGSFIILATYDKISENICFDTVDVEHSSEHSLIMLSSESDQYLSESESTDCWWSSIANSNDQDANNDITCSSSSAAAAKYQVVFKVDNNNLEDQQQQQQLVFKLDSFGFPQHLKLCYHKGIGVPRHALDPNEIVGSCNGLVCLYDRHCNKFTLWNPATGQFRSLPDSITICGEHWDCPPDKRLVAFGFDVKTNDYKVVLLTDFRSNTFRTILSISRVPMECLCRVQVYSLSTDSWRLLKGSGGRGDGVISLPGYPFFQYQTEILYLNGSCFFPAHFFHSKHQRCIPENNRFIISLDLTKEIIIPIQLPYHLEDKDLYLFSYLGDKIVLFTASTKGSTLDGTEICCDVFDIWVLNEYGSRSNNSVKMESWTNLPSFQIERERLCECNLPRGISNDGDFALLETIDSSSSTATSKKMKLYSLVTKEVKGNFLSCSRVMSKAYPYKRSQVPVMGGNGAAAAIAADRVIGNDATKL